jgi:competence protein ComGC
LPPAAPGQFLETPKKRISVGLLVAIGAIAIIFLAAVIIVPIVLVSGTANQDAQKRSCQANLRTVDGAIMTYTAMSSEETYPSSLEDLVAPDTRVLKSIPTCPSGNKPYEWVEGEGGSPPNISCPNNAKHTI